ncbi:hypothetical protein [Labrys monachus]|uniref:Uncharacterized protein n=1 Tax=Labrys monachus TaxID=217067 RepID=A0ABU0FI96_9HYPH|nr:hypothetical protein [Labrys monachus]MDQ0394331.1 hypothetical protein [Labrys monachus]
MISAGSTGAIVSMIRSIMKLHWVKRASAEAGASGLKIEASPLTPFR